VSRVGEIQSALPLLYIRWRYSLL